MWPNNIVAWPGCRGWCLPPNERGAKETLLAVAALVGAMQMLSGAPEVILLTWFCWGPCLPGRWRSTRRKDGGYMPALHGGRALVGGWPGAVAPVFGFWRLPARQGIADSLGQCQPGLGQLPGAVVSQLSHFKTVFMQNQNNSGLRRTIWGGRNALGIPRCPSGTKARVWLLGAITVFCLLMALGEHGLLYSALKRLVPGLGFMRTL